MRRVTQVVTHRPGGVADVGDTQVHVGCQSPVQLDLAVADRFSGLA